MLNRVEIMGRICNDIQVQHTSGGIAYLRLRIACDQDYCAEGKERQTDFLNVTAWRNDAMFIANNFRKGNMIFIEGKLSENNYEHENVKVYSTEITVTKARFTGEYTKTNLNQQKNTEQAQHVDNTNYADEPMPEPPEECYPGF